MMPTSLRDAVARYTWYHSIDLGDGVVTPGMFDHRPAVGRYLLPSDLAGMRCLDVGTMDGFWAFEMERRGASEVVAFDIDHPEALDWPVALRAGTVKTLDETKGARFQLVHDALGSAVRRELGSVYELDTGLGTFDLVFCSDVLLHLKDPVGALERIRSVTAGSAIVCNPILRFRFQERRPLALFDGIDEFQWWVTNLAGLIRMVRAAGFAAVEAGRPFELPATAGGPWKGLRGVVRASVGER
ncbi:MAG: class I SAM-dependent methyltransferase [Actinomycetota bacterium]